MEIPIQQILRDFACFAIVRTVFLHSGTADQPRLLHRTLDGPMVQGQSPAAKFNYDRCL